MTQEQSATELISVDALLERVTALRSQGYRVVQIGATRLPELVELTYTFDRDGLLAQLRLHLPPDEPHVPSISSIYGCVILYENELHDLFNIHVDGMAVDFKGNLYQTTVKFPFGTVKAPVARPKPAPRPPASNTQGASPPTSAS